MSVRSDSGRPLLAVLAGGAAAGVLDIAAAFAISSLRGGNPVRVLQSIASGLLGAEAFKGGAATAALGLALHFFIATTAAAVFYLGSQWSAAFLRRPLVSGAVYGVVVCLVMNFVVIPLSAIGRWPTLNSMAAVLVAVHIACVGIPIALTARRYAAPPSTVGG